MKVEVIRNESIAYNLIMRNGCFSINTYIFSMDYLFETIFKHSNRQFKYLQDLGKGVFGNVFLVASSKGEKFALKVINLEKMDNGSTEKVM
jgi:serine/threonine protein kinase